jgi:glycosyltransferase involved in cell wall biosynthesis
MRVAILAQFPIHLLPEFAHLGEPLRHYATWLPQLSASFASATDFEFHWITLTTEVTAPQTVTFQNQTFHLLPTATRRRASTLFAQDRKAIATVLDRIAPDLVHGWGTEDVYALAAVTSGYRNLVSMAGLLSYYVLKTKMHPRDYFQAMVELFVLRKAERITVETEWGRKILRRRTSRPIDLVEYGVRPTFFEAKWDPDPARPTALFVGSISPRKGIQDLIPAFNDDRLKNAELIVAGAGSGPWADALRSSSPPNVRWLGQVSPAEIRQELQRAWCLVLPTRCDTSPNVVKEARVIGLPIVTTSEGGQSDYIQQGKNGFLVNPGEVLNLSIRLAELLTELQNCREMGAWRHNQAREHFRPTRTAELFLQNYRTP